MAMAQTARRVATIDPSKWVQENVWPVIKENFPRTQFCKKIDDLRGDFDAAFIDGDHRYGAVMSDIRVCKYLLPRRAPIALHDTTEPMVFKAMQDTPGFEFQIVIPGVTGLGVGFFPVVCAR